MVHEGFFAGCRTGQENLGPVGEIRHGRRQKRGALGAAVEDLAFVVVRPTLVLRTPT